MDRRIKISKLLAIIMIILNLNMKSSATNLDKDSQQNTDCQSTNKILNTDKTDKNSQQSTDCQSTDKILNTDETDKNSQQNTDCQTTDQIWNIIDETNFTSSFIDLNYDIMKEINTLLICCNNLYQIKPALKCYEEKLWHIIWEKDPNGHNIWHGYNILNEDEKKTFDLEFKKFQNNIKIYLDGARNSRASSYLVSLDFCTTCSTASKMSKILEMKISNNVKKILSIQDLLIMCLESEIDRANEIIEKLDDVLLNLNDVLFNKEFNKKEFNEMKFNEYRNCIYRVGYTVDSMFERVKRAKEIAHSLNEALEKIFKKGLENNTNKE